MECVGETIPNGRNGKYKNAANESGAHQKDLHKVFISVVSCICCARRIRRSETYEGLDNSRV